MTTNAEHGWKTHEAAQRAAWLKLTPAERLNWLEEAKRFAEAARSARRIRRDEGARGPASA